MECIYVGTQTRTQSGVQIHTHAVNQSRVHVRTHTVRLSDMYVERQSASSQARGQSISHLWIHTDRQVGRLFDMHDRQAGRKADMQVDSHADTQTRSTHSCRQKAGQVFTRTLRQARIHAGRKADRFSRAPRQADM